MTSCALTARPQGGRKQARCTSRSSSALGRYRQARTRLRRATRNHSRPIYDASPTPSTVGPTRLSQGKQRRHDRRAGQRRRDLHAPAAWSIPADAPAPLQFTVVRLVIARRISRALGIPPRHGLRQPRNEPRWPLNNPDRTRERPLQRRPSARLAAEARTAALFSPQASIEPRPPA